MKESPIFSKSFAFSIKAIELYKSLIELREYDLARQFFKSATSICANVNEASAAFSYNDFAYKMSIASKEARESLLKPAKKNQQEMTNSTFKTYNL